MFSMESQVYNWFVKNGNILIKRNEDHVSVQIDYENGESCLITRSDADEIIQLLTGIAKQIWQDPAYERRPYTGQLYKKVNNGYSWETETSELVIKFNEIEDAIEVKYKGNRTLNLEINYVVEVIQILEHLNS